MKFCIYSSILIFSIANFNNMSAYDNSFTIPINFSDMVMNIIKQFFMSNPDTDQDSIIEQSTDNCEKNSGNNNSELQDQDETLLFSRLEKEFITQTHWIEFKELERQCSEESEENRNLFVKKLRGFKSNKYTYPLSDKELDELVDTLISIKYNAIINTLLIMKKTEQSKDQFGVFNEILDFMEKNKDFASNEKKGEQFVKKIVEIMNEERRKSIDNGKPDEFEKIFLSHGLSKEKSLLWYTLFAQYQYDYAEKNFASLVRFATSTIDLQ